MSTVATYINQFLKQKRIDTVFVLQGGMITRLVDALTVNVVNVHHEQAAAMCADAYGRVTNKPGVAFATSGPGAVNLLTGIGSCYFDSVPAIFITGQVNSKQYKASNSRQTGFQETDIISMAKPITKKVYEVKKPDDITFILHDAYNVAIGGRMGPVLIDIPIDLQNKEIDIIRPNYHILDSKPSSDILDFIEKYQDSLRVSKRPMILVGRGIRTSETIKQFSEFNNLYNIPVVTSLLGKDVCNSLGMIGTYGNRYANYALGNCDVLLVLGSRLDIRQIASDFGEGKTIFHVDIDGTALNDTVLNCKVLKADLKDFFSVFSNCLYFKYDVPNKWIEEIIQQKRLNPDTEEIKDCKGINPNVFVKELANVFEHTKVFIADVGSNQMWVAQSLQLRSYQQFITSGGMGAMGYALPAAIGASVALGNVPVLAIMGDGGIQINIQELATIKRYNLPIKIIVLNNNSLGMIRQFQDAYFDRRYVATVFDSPNFVKIAEAYGIKGMKVSTKEEIELGLNSLWENEKEPFLLEVEIDMKTDVHPKVMWGNKLTEMT